MEYEIVTLEEKTVAGIAARTNNAAPDMGSVTGGLWGRFYQQGIYGRIPGRINGKALGIEKGDYTVMAACETNAWKTGEELPIEGVTLCRIPAGRYAKFVVHGDMVQAVAAAWQEIWQMGLPRAFGCDFEEYQDGSMENSEIHIYVGLKEEKTGMVESRCGILCGECEYRGQMNCGGCVHIEKPFWGESCPVKSCCEEKGLAHCGECESFPCGLLNQFAYDEKQGDNGKRIVQCRKWREA